MLTVVIVDVSNFGVDVSNFGVLVIAAIFIYIFFVRQFFSSLDIFAAMRTNQKLV